MKKSKIEWTERTWNPTTGCDKVSPGCKFCYAETFSKRLQTMGIKKYKNGFELTLHPETIDIPRRLKPSMIFVNSMSDLFHEKIPLEYIQQVFKVMNECPHHIFQVLTKRAEMLGKYAHLLSWTPNIWMGITAENQQEYEKRIGFLMDIPCHSRFISMEPLLRPIYFSCKGREKKVDWIICGGESGPAARPMHPQWARLIRDQCLDNNIPFFFKQWGEWYPVSDVYAVDGPDKALEYFEHESIQIEPDGAIPFWQKGDKYRCDYQPVPGSWNMAKVGKKKAGRILDGQTWDQFPEA